MFGFSKKAAPIDMKFYKEANHFGEHGKIVVSHKKFGLDEVAVAFFFVGSSRPPALDKRTMLELWEAAEAQGFIPHHIQSYGKNSEVINEEVVTAIPELSDPIHFTGQNLVVDLPDLSSYTEGYSGPEQLNRDIKRAAARRPSPLPDSFFATHK